MAGVFDKKPAAKAAPAAAPAKKPAATNGNGLPRGFSAGTKIKYDGGGGWVTGVLRSVEPVVLDLDDSSEIEVSKDVLREAISIGIVALQ